MSWSNIHKFNVRQDDGTYEETEFHFDRVVSRQEARRIVSKINGYKLKKD